ncbi:MAG: penicillin acylase family protein, partial [Planctomycetota bacterium]
AYCDGVNSYLQQHPDKLPYRVPRIKPIQVLARHRQVFLLSAVVVSRADAEASKSDGYHPVYRSDGEPSARPRIPVGKSNSWALAPAKTAVGAPMLLIDPHWASQGHLQLYEAYLHGGELQAGGFMLNGTPLPGIGVSPAAAWTVTAGGADSSDAYALKINPNDPHQYEFDGDWEPMTVRRETIRIRDGDSYREETVESMATRHGPVLRTKTGVPFAAAFGGHDHADSIEQTYRMAVAGNAKEFQAVIAMDRYSYFNLMWITREGDIGYVQTGRVPKRPPGFNWEKLLPGWTSRSLYTGQLSFDELPAVVNPPTGFLQNCNVAANEVTTGLEFSQDDFPTGALYGHYGQYRARGRRATHLLSALEEATLDDGRRVAFDSYVPPADLWIPVILEAYDEFLSGDTEQKSTEEDKFLHEAVGLLRTWDRYATRDSTGATVFRFWRFACSDMEPPVGRDSLTIQNTPDLRREALKALRNAAQRLKSTYGRVAVPWGNIKRLRRGDQEWPLSGDGLGKLGMDTLRATAGDTLNGEHKLVMAGGQCVTSIVLLTDPPTIRSVVAYGQSNQPGSTHFDDQAPLFSAERLREVHWTLDQLQGHIERTRTVRYAPLASASGQ